VLPSLEDVFRDNQTLVQVKKAIGEVLPLSYLVCKGIESLASREYSSRNTNYLRHGSNAVMYSNRRAKGA
jgi:hypothetical protein